MLARFAEVAPCLRAGARARSRSRSEEAATTCRIFYDCETSGVGCERYKQPRIVELAAVADWAPGDASSAAGRGRGAPGQLPEGHFSELVSGGEVSAWAEAVHGLSEAQLRGARPFEEVWESFVLFAHDAQRRASRCNSLSLVGHNSRFTDNYWLLAELARCRRSVEELALPGVRVVFEDTLPRKKGTRAQLKEALRCPSLKNSDLHRRLCSEQYEAGDGAEAHTALWDAAATRDNWRHPEVRRATERLSLAQQLESWEALQRPPQSAPR
jgi:DNA polymerase III epsilon subunit-like protein